MARVFVFFFFQAEDGIRDWSVTGVQTCALPIFCCGVDSRHCEAKTGCVRPTAIAAAQAAGATAAVAAKAMERNQVPTVKLSIGIQIGRASCRERVEIAVVDGAIEGKGSTDELVK